MFDCILQETQQSYSQSSNRHLATHPNLELQHGFKIPVYQFGQLRPHRKPLQCYNGQP